MIISLEPNEKVLLTIRKHWFHIFMKAFSLVIVLLIMFTGIYLLTGFSEEYIQIQGNKAVLSIFVLMVFVFFAWMSFFIFWTKYYLDYWLVTDRRIIDMDLIGFFNQNVAVMRLDHIQDVEIQAKGFFANIFGFGSLQVQSAGTEKEFMIRNVANPEKLKEQIFHLQSQLLEQPQKVEVVS